MLEKDSSFARSFGHSNAHVCPATHLIIYAIALKQSSSSTIIEAKALSLQLQNTIKIMSTADIRAESHQLLDRID